MRQLFFYTFVYGGLLCLFLSWKGSETVYAQTLTFSADYFTRFRHLTTKDGLCANEVLNILQDKYGMMWFATVNGLTKYDGLHYTNYYYSAEDPRSISDNEVTSLAEDRQGNV